MNEQLTTSIEPNLTLVKPKNRSLPPNLTRRPHRKSRNGCHRCKRRRIKCDESRPACYNCAGRLLTCVYPTPPSQPSNRHHQHHQILSSISVIEHPLCTIPKPFSWIDIRAFHHFLIVCPPSLPFGNRDVWISHIPQIAHQVPFLMHGVLAFGSSHLSQLTKSPDLKRQALLHRGRAIAGVRNHVHRIASWSMLDIDAAIATSYVLAFQATHIPDGMDEYLAFVRGCGSLTQHVRVHNLASGFKLSNGRATAKYGARIAVLLAGESEVQLINKACGMFGILKPLLTDPVDIEFFNAVRSVLSNFDSGACAGVLAAMNMFTIWHHFAGAYIKTFLKTDTTISRLLLLYFLTMQVILWGLLPSQWWCSSFLLRPPGQPFAELLQWMAALMASVPDGFEDMLVWPRTITSQFCEVVGEMYDTSGVVLDPAMKDLCVRNIRCNAHVVTGDILRLCAEINIWFEELLNLVIDKAANTVCLESSGGQLLNTRKGCKSTDSIKGSV